MKEQALVIAVRECWEPIVEYLIQLDAKVSRKVGGAFGNVQQVAVGYSAMFVALYYSSESIIEYLLQQPGVDFQEVDLVRKSRFNFTLDAFLLMMIVQSKQNRNQKHC